MAPWSVRSPRRQLGLICAAVALVGPGCARGTGPPAAETRPADVLKRAVLRTLDEGSARVVARVRSAPDAVVVVEGVASLVGPEASLKATVEGHPDTVASEVRVTAAGAWLRLPGSTEWISVDAVHAGASPAGSWRGVLQDLAEASHVAGGGRRLTAMVEGTPVTVVLDHRGRVGRVQRQHEGIDVSLELSDFGVGVEVDPP